MKGTTKVSGVRRRGNARYLWPSVLRLLAHSPRTTAEHILDVWARMHGRALCAS